MLPTRSPASSSPPMPVTLDAKGCLPSTPKASFVPPLLSTAAASAPKSPFQRHGSEKHVLFCITNAPMALPPPTPIVEKKRLPPLKMYKAARRASGPPPPVITAPGPFLFLKKVQSGSYGDVVAARELDNEWLQGAPGRVVCMKVFTKATALLRGLIPGVVQEVIAYRNMARANLRISSTSEGAAFVMDLEASLQDENRVFFVMELMDCDLLAVFNGYRFSLKHNAQRWICQTALGLAHVHACGIIHRDIKPENLLIDVEGNIRISDFGSAYTRDDCAPVEASQVYTHEVTGTWAYMAPEMLANRRKAKFQTQKYGPAVDYWSLGCVAFELVAQEPNALFESEEELRKYQTWHQTVHSTSYLSFAGLSEDAESVVSGLLHLDPLKRFTLPDLREHQYFQINDGLSEFACTIPRNCQRRHQSREFDSFPLPSADAEPSLIDGHPNVFSLSLDPPEMDKDDTFEHFGWINPQGIWGKQK
ncbi:kinase-like domain-containing protein [Mycena metata]|uniref:non-specific serine/threonine protein kinase n=1 Tax=Mycena metata TaxID=1033252 RepID=A0AAD7NEL2_9AGAR|nr:kinase-like domain-containing protein [Mycena metata]